MRVRSFLCGPRGSRLQALEMQQTQNKMRFEKFKCHLGGGGAFCLVVCAVVLSGASGCVGQGVMMRCGGRRGGVHNARAH